LYEQILGIGSPWNVDRVELNLAGGECMCTWHTRHRRRGHARSAAEPVRCTTTNRSGVGDLGYVPISHDFARRGAAGQLSRARSSGGGGLLGRAAQPLHGVVRAVGDRLAVGASQQAVADRLGLSWDEVHAIMERAVRRGLKRRKTETIGYLGVDEKSFRKGHKYLTVVNDLARGRVLYVAEDRKQSSLDGFWTTLTEEQRAWIQGVALDMWDPYVRSIRKHLPDAEEKMVFDKFHVAKHLGDAVDKVRRREHRQLQEKGDDRLKGTKYDWLKSRGKFDLSKWREFCTLRRGNLKTARAWALKEQAMRLWDFSYPQAARNHFTWWYRWASHSRLPAMIEKAKMLKAHLQNILTYLTHGITNARARASTRKSSG